MLQLPLLLRVPNLDDNKIINKTDTVSEFHKTRKGERLAPNSFP